MKRITLEAKNTEAIAFDVAELMARLDRLPDTRDRRGKIYPLGMVLTLIILAKLAGEDKPSGICEWIRLRRDTFVAVFNCQHQRMPCLNTIRWILQEVISVEALEKEFTRFLYETYGGRQSQLIAIDGKTMRGTIPKGQTQGVHLLAAYMPAEGIVLKQVMVDAKENEIVGAKQLFEGLNLKDKVVCGDAMHTQRAASIEILRGGGHYIWFLKENQPTVRADVEQFFAPPPKSAGWPLPQLPQTMAQSMQKQHGRLDQRRLTLMVDRSGCLDWPGANQVFRLERKSLHLRTGRQSCEVVYGLTSCDSKKADAEQLLAWTRDYWGIENGLHYRRDVTLREDATRIAQSALARVMAAINNFVVGLAASLGYANLASARRAFDAEIAAQLST